MIPCLRNNDIVMFCCTVEGDEMVSLWVQQNPVKLEELRVASVVVAEPKKPNGQRFQVTIPDDLTEVSTDVRFPIIPLGSE
jgi:hypothetical protein